jgi:hypothetical protein
MKALDMYVLCQNATDLREGKKGKATKQDPKQAGGYSII